MNTITFKDLSLTNSYLVNVMNAVRCMGDTWTFTGGFSATSNTVATALF